VALPFGLGLGLGLVGLYALASALCRLVSCVAPVRGGTYFSLPRQRKVGKRKPLTPSVLTVTHGPPTSPCFTPQRSIPSSLPTLRIHASPAANTRTSANPVEAPPPICGALFAGCRTAGRGTECFLARTARSMARKPTHRLPQMGTHQAFVHAVEEVIEVGEALIRSVGNEEELEGLRMKHGDVESPWVGVKTLGVSGFLLPTFLCRAPRRKSPWGTKKSRCRPAQGQRMNYEGITPVPA